MPIKSDDLNFAEPPTCCITFKEYTLLFYKLGRASEMSDSAAFDCLWIAVFGQEIIQLCLHSIDDRLYASSKNSI